MDTKSKRFSYSIWVKAIAVLLVLGAFALGAAQVYDIAQQTQTGYTPTLAQNYDTSDSAFWNATDLENCVLRVAQLRDETYIKEGRTITQERLVNWWRNFCESEFPSYYYNEYYDRHYAYQEPPESYYAYSQHWEEDLEQLLSESTLVLSRDEKGNIIATRQGPEAEGGLKEFEQAYQSVLERLPQECIANDLNEYRSYMATIQSEPNLHYYVNHDGFVFTNLPDGREPTYTDQPIYFVLENGSVQMRMGGTRISGVLGSGGYAIEETADDIFSPSGWYDGFYSNIDILNQYSSTDTAYIWLTQEYVEPIQQKIEYDRALTLDYMRFFGVDVLVLLAGLIYLIAAAGKSRTGESVRLIWLDRMFTEFNLCLLVGVAGVYIGLCFLSWEMQSRNFLLGSSVACAAVFLVLLLSLVRMMKGHRFWRNSLVWKLCKWLAKPFQKAWRAIQLSLNQGPTVKRTVWFTVLFGTLCMLLAIVFPLAIALIVLAAIFVHKQALAYQTVRDGVTEICSGHLDYQINTGEDNCFSDLAADINHIADGLHAAVENELKSERMKSELVTNVSHDIRTPLTSIITYVDLIQKEGLTSENAPGYFDVISQKAMRLKALTDDLFEVSKASSGNIQVHWADVDLADLVRQSLGELSDKVEASGLDFRVNLPADGIVVRADGKLLWRVVENLLSNVFKYAMPASRVYLDVTEHAGHGVFTVKNISAYELNNVAAEELMERFKRGDAARHSEGNGLGLAIAKNFVELQGGVFQITVDGDLFKAMVCLPKANRADRPAPAEQEEK